MSKWRFNSTPFFGKDATIVTEFTDADDLPALRGDNPTIPLREGRPDVDLVYDQRKISMGLYMSSATRSAFETSHDGLRKLFGDPRQRLLERIMEDGSIRKVWAKSMNLQVKRVSPLAMKLTIDFLMASPFFRSSVKTTDTQTVSTSPITYTLTQPGTAEDRSAILTLTGPLSCPKVSNLITDPITGLARNILVGLNITLTAGQVVVIDVAAFTCLQNATNILGDLVHSGDPYFMVLKSGANSMQIESLATGGTVKIEYYAPYF
jgi:hypothetical protein